jgi:alcohol dehydrogenase (cytochrome c)
MKSGGEQIMMAPAIYMQNGKQYVTFVTGTKIVTYGLNGKKSVTNEKTPQGSGKTDDANHGSHGNKEAPRKQPTQSINAETIYKKSCVSCHGQNLEGGAGPNLQHVGSSMSEADILKQIVKGGGRMPGGLATGDEAAALAKWLADKK